MRAGKHSPLFRIALLSLAVLFAQTAHATKAQPIPVRPPCPRKAAAAQPDPQKKLIAGKRLAAPGDRCSRHTFIEGSFGLTAASAGGLFVTHSAGLLAVVRRSACIPPQRLPFALRI